MDIRNIKIDIVLGNPNEIVDEFIRITDGIQIINVPVYEKHEQEFIWYAGDTWLFYQDLKNDRFWCNYDEYWSIFESKFSLNYRDIQSITKFMVETAFKNGVGTPLWLPPSEVPSVETAFKNGVGTPETESMTPLEAVETAFKNGVGTPCRSQSIIIFMVETAFKNGVGTLDEAGKMVEAKVETAFKNVVGTPMAFFSTESLEVENAFKNECI